MTTPTEAGPFARTWFTQASTRIAAVLVFTWLALAGLSVEAQTVGGDPRVREAINLLHRWIDAQREYEQFPGISMAVVYKQEVLWSAGLGYADVETQRPATPETQYSICSISKLFTSVAAMRLRDLGKIELDDSVSALLPWFTLKHNLEEESLVSVRGLLTHTAGFDENFGELPDTEPYLYRPSRKAIRSLISKERLIYHPGEHYHYTNTSMMLMGEIIGEVAEQSYVRYVRQQILAPLGMLSTSPDIGEILKSERLATGYGPTQRGGGRRTVRPVEGNAMIPAKGYASTVEDLARFAMWQFRVLETGTSEIVEATTLREMHRVQFVDPATDDSVGLGFLVYNEEGDKLVGHGGDCPGYRSDFTMIPEKGIAVIALSNAMIPVWKFTARARDILQPAIESVLEDPDGGQAIRADLLKYTGTYDGFPWSGEFQVIPWRGSLAVVRFPTDEPMSVLRELEHLEGNRFRGIRDDGLRRMEYSFEADSDGRIVRMRTDDYARPRID